MLGVAGAPEAAPQYGYRLGMGHEHHGFEEQVSRDTFLRQIEGVQI
jgi:hypothetical protein